MIGQVHDTGASGGLMQPLEIDYTIYVATSRERLWEGLTTAEDTRQYWAEEI